jgi:hypothetical protein
VAPTADSSWMNKLAYRCTDDNGLSFELLVDGEPLGKLVGAHDWAIPFWDIVDDLPYFPPHGRKRGADIRIVCCCSCGEYGCGHTQCRVLHENDVVLFRDFDFDASPDGQRRVFRFSADNYQTVVSEIVVRARAMQERHDMRLG